MNDYKPTQGEVFRINITPASTSFPWIQLFHHPYGIRKPATKDPAGGVNAAKDREELAKQIGEMVIDASEILSEWVDG